ncbi:MAG: hypothetical protein NXI30_25085 [bacterium]|nr:hypothetical protein [bacterium]
MQRDERRFRTDRPLLVGLILLLSLAFAAPVFAADEATSDLPENVLAEDDETEKFEVELEDDGHVDRSLSERLVRVRATSLLARVCTLIDRRHLRRMIPRAPPLA